MIKEKIKYELVKFTIASFLMLLPPIFIIYLFEEGFWMSVSLFFYAACCGGYISFLETLFPILQKNNLVIDDKISLVCISLCVCFQLLLIIIAFFPFAMMSENFIKLINAMFDLNFDTSYEGGLVVSLLTFCIIILLVHTLVQFFISLKNRDIELKRGIFLFVVFVISFIVFGALRVHNNNSVDFQIIQTQSEKDDEQLDRDIMKYKMQKYKKYSDHLYE